MGFSNNKYPHKDEPETTKLITLLYQPSTLNKLQKKQSILATSQ